MKKCPFCAEEIMDEATKCKHCGSELTRSILKKKITCSGCLIVFLVLIGLAIIIPNLMETQQPAPTPRSAPKPYKQEPPSPEAAIDSKVEIIDYPAKLRPDVDAVHTSLATIPVGTQLEVLDKRAVKTGGTLRYRVIWYKVEYKGKTGWISEYVCKKVE